MAGRRNYIQKGSGERVSGVTTQIGILDKPALKYWAYNQGLFNYEELSKEIAKLLTDKKKIGKAMIARSSEEKLEAISKALTKFTVLGLYEKRDEAADAGTLAHSMMEAHIRGDKFEVPKKTKKAIREKAEKCFATYLKWEEAQKPKWLHTELPLTSEKMKVGGTIDGIIERPDGIEIFDLKTGKDIYFGARVQVATYGFLWWEHNPNVPITGYHILRVGPDGEFTHKYYPSLKEYFSIFKDINSIFLAMKVLGEKL